MDTKDYASKIGKDFAPEVELDFYQTKEGHKATVSIGEEYYESDPYRSRDLALYEVKGLLESVKAKIEGTLQAIAETIN